MRIAAQVSARLPRPSGGPPARPGGSPTEIPPDWIDLSELPADARRVAPIEDARQALEVAPPVLARPLLMIHGLAQHADTWVNMKSFLCSDPRNVWGGVYSTDREAEFLASARSRPGARVFALDLSDNLAHPRVVANEVRRAIDAICAATGAREVDVLTHSMGALVAREALRQGEDRINSLCMIAPPNHGAYEASLASGLHDVGIYDHYPESRMGAMDALRLEFGPLGGVRNEWLHGLNEHWKTSARRPRAAVITGSGIATPDRSLRFGTATGDAMVAARRAPLEGAEFYLAVPHKLPPGDANFRDFQHFRYNHLQVVSEPEIYRQVGLFLSGGGTPPPAPPGPPGPTPPATDFDNFLNQVQDRTRDLRRRVADADYLRRHHALWQRYGTYTAAAGVGLWAAAMGLAPFAPALSAGLLAGGVLAAGVGSVVAVLNATRLSRAVAGTMGMAEEALNLSDTVVHRVRQELPPGGAPTAPARVWVPAGSLPSSPGRDGESPHSVG
ncbi:MAG TPA: alpha/beta fold hydrolase [Candidatus Nitrosotenuis sp.]|nr:alpha/beta fold hydrolase [Candidatus Nitrosotenuis sp.]